MTAMNFLGFLNCENLSRQPKLKWHKGQNTPFLVTHLEVKNQNGDKGNAEKTIIGPFFGENSLRSTYVLPTARGGEW